MRLNLDFLYRKKHFDATNVEQTQLARVLNTLDLTMLGIGCTFGTGIYILIGNVISNYSGPSVVLSFVVAGIASFLSGMCYAELGARVPRSGSAYAYIYVTVGEFVAFIIGWDLILEYMIGSAGTANALSQYINALCGDKIKHALRSAMPMDVNGLGPYPDFFAFVITMVIVVILIIGVKESAVVNKIFVFINTAIILLIIIFGAIRSNPKNWKLTESDLYSNKSTYSHSDCKLESKSCGTGGFLPYGFYGMMQGAAKCFYAYIGFDCIATTGEEVKNPRRALPLAIILTLTVCTVAYIGVSVVISLMIPYFLIDANAPLPSAFSYVHYDVAKYVISVGAIASLATCLFASMFPMPRVVYAIAHDGLIFKFLSKVILKFKTPAVATLLTGIITGLLATFFDLNELVEMTSIGTLLAYSLVSICVLILRYTPSRSSKYMDKDNKEVNIELQNIPKKKFFVKEIFIPLSEKCTETSSKIANIAICFGVLDVIAMSLILTRSQNGVSILSIVFLVIFLLFLLVCIVIITRQPQNTTIETFKIPCVQVLPFLSVFINSYLMMTLTLVTWIRFFVWFVIGFAVYFLYGIRHSLENKNPRGNSNWLSCFVRNDTVVKCTDQPPPKYTLKEEY